jgi:beta-glucosidase
MSYEDNPALPNYPGANNEVRYEEGVMVGYRHYDTNGVTPRFPFGHGLSYTTFDYGPLNVEKSGDEVRAAIEVTNTGDMAGKEVVQLYVTDSECSVRRPTQELKAFEKVSLSPGETKSVRFVLGPRAFSFWGETGWVTEPGEFELRCGSSSRDIRTTAALTL